MSKLSIIIPIYNEEGNILRLFERLNTVLSQLNLDGEFVFVNDGSKDGSMGLIKNLASKHANVLYIDFARNFGHQVAVTAGLDYCSGKAVVIIDADLQDPPELIHELHSKYKEGFKVVYARRTSRQGESFFKKSTARFFYRMLKRITSIDIPLDTGDFRLISHGVAGKLMQMGESNKFLRGQIAWLGYKAAFVNFERPTRKKGTTKYTLRKMIRFAFDGITSFSNFPLQIATFLGFLFSLVAFGLILYSLYSKFILNQVVTGWTSLMVSTMFIGGVQLLCIGIIGEYMIRIGTDVKKRPSFIVEENNLDKPL